MILGIDASNIRGGGGVTHLVEVLKAVDPLCHGFSKVIVWSGKSTLDKIEDRPWLVKSYQPLLEKPLPYRIYWQRFRLSRLAKASGCNVLLIPGGSYSGDFKPFVAMSQNMLPFEWSEMRRYGLSMVILKVMLLRWTQSHTFNRADGLIFLTKYAHDNVLQVIKHIVGKPTVIPHGIDSRFKHSPKDQTTINNYSKTHPFRLLYVSHIEQYKHQWHVADATSHLYTNGLPVKLNLIGPKGNAINRLEKTLKKIDPERNFIQYLGAVPHNKIHEFYSQADLCVFASSCENMPNILLEAMASGLPIACSNRGPMPEVLGDAGVYFDPEKPIEIAAAVRKLIEDPNLRAQKASAAFERAKIYSWDRCAQETFSFLSEIAREVI